MALSSIRHQLQLHALGQSRRGLATLRRHRRLTCIKCSVGEVVLNTLKRMPRSQSSPTSVSSNETSSTAAE